MLSPLGSIVSSTTVVEGDVVEVAVMDAAEVESPEPAELPASEEPLLPSSIGIAGSMQLAVASPRTRTQAMPGARGSEPWATPQNGQLGS
jgi:hypothetical protein